MAEYAAGVLLRYSDKYERRLITKEQREKQDEAKVETTTSPPGATPTATSVPETADSAAPTASGSDAPKGTTEPVPEVSLDELYQLDGVQVSYDSCRFTKRYGSSQIRADKGQTLFVVTFALKNVSGAGKEVSLMDRRNITYTLDVDGSQYSPGINMLPNGGMDYLDTSIAKGKTEKAVLIFQMDTAKQSASAMTLTIEEGSKRTSLKLK